MSLHYFLKLCSWLLLHLECISTPFNSYKSIRYLEPAHNLVSCHFLPHPLCSQMKVLYIAKFFSHLRAFALAVLSAWRYLLPILATLLLIILHVSAQMSLPQRGFLYLLTLTHVIFCYRVSFLLAYALTSSKHQLLLPTFPS